MHAIDLFAGAGGFTEGATAAGLKVVWAANHWELAVSVHELNHPGTDHKCQDLRQADWGELPPHDIGLASPCCQGHSRARGKEKPHHEKQRNTAWAVVECAEYHREDIWIIENIIDFKKWILFPVWADAMTRLGYSRADIVINAADHSVPQDRERLFMVFTKSKKPIALNLPKSPHVSADSVIEWDAYRWNLINKPGRSQNTLHRINNGRNAFGNRFLAPFYGSGSGKTGRCLSRPIGTITTLDRWAVINGDSMRMIQPSEARKFMGFRDTYKLPPTRREAINLLGNAVCPPVATDLINAINKAA